MYTFQNLYMGVNDNVRTDLDLHKGSKHRPVMGFKHVRHDSQHVCHCYFIFIYLFFFFAKEKVNFTTPSLFTSPCYFSFSEIENIPLWTDDDFVFYVLFNIAIFRRWNGDNESLFARYRCTNMYGTSLQRAFHFLRDSKPGSRYPKLGSLSTWPSERF